MLREVLNISLDTEEINDLWFREYNSTSYLVSVFKNGIEGVGGVNNL